MTLAAAAARYQFTGDGTSRSFPFSPPFIDPSDLLVDLRDPSGNAVGAVLNGAGTYDYTVTGTPDAATGEYLAGGAVLFNTAPPGNYRITLFRDPPADQDLALAIAGPLPPLAINTEFDRTTMLVQALLDRAGRSIKAPVWDGVPPNGPSMQLPGVPARRGNLLGFDGSGNVIMVPPLALAPPGPGVECSSICLAADTTGHVDALPAILAAEALLLLTGGGTIDYPAGTILVNGSIPDLHNIYHAGAGNDATTIVGGGDYPVFLRDGSNSNVINGGGIRDMTIRGAWLASNPSANTSSIGVHSTGANRAVYKNLTFRGCYVGLYSGYSFETYWDHCSADGAGADQNNIGFYQDATILTTDVNAVISKDCIAQNCLEYGLRIINGQGSLHTGFQALGSGVHGVYLGGAFTDNPGFEFCFFFGCQSDSSGGSNWLLGSDNTEVWDYCGFYDCWAGNAAVHGLWVDSVDAAISNIEFQNFKIARAGQNGVLVTGGTQLLLNGVTVSLANGSNGGYAAVNLNGATYTSVVGCTLQALNGGRSLDENGAADHNNIQSNWLPNGAHNLVNNTMWRNNQGFVTESAGTATITAGNTSVTVNHELAITPTLGEISLIAGSNPGSGGLFAGTITGTQFTISIGAALAGDLAVGWRAGVTRGGN